MSKYLIRIQWGKFGGLLHFHIHDWNSLFVFVFFFLLTVFSKSPWDPYLFLKIFLVFFKLQYK